MRISHTKVTGLDEARLVALIEPVLLAHGVVGVELLWKPDPVGWVLSLSVEKEDAKLPGEGITLDLCAQLSRELSAALDAEELIERAYRLEVGSPGLERELYSLDDFRRFQGLVVKVKLNRSLSEQRVLRGSIAGADEQANVQLVTEDGSISIAYDSIASARLVFDWNSPNVSGEAKAKLPKSRAPERAQKKRASKRKR